MNAAGLLELVSDLPYAIDGKFCDGSVLTQPKFCRSKCESRDCLALQGSSSNHYICSKGFSCYPGKAFGANFVVNGLIVAGLNPVQGDRRKANKANCLLPEQVDRLFQRLSKAEGDFRSEVVQGAKDSVSFLHDVRTSVGIVLAWCQRVIAQAPGASFDEKLQNTDRATRHLFQAINLLREQLDLGDIIVNPTAITYGPKRPSSLTGFLYRMMKIFEPRAEERGCDFAFSGDGEIPITTWNSFQFIPLILIDNAVKYSFRNRTIRIHIWNEAGGPCFSVSSFGRTVPPEYRERIFEKYVRAPSAIEEHPEGMGIGLFLAQQIAEAHAFRVEYNPPDPEVAVGNNEFLVRLFPSR